MKINGFNKIYAEQHRQLCIGSSNELFDIVVAKNIVHRNTNVNWANEYTMWIRPDHGWGETDVFGNWTPVCKIDWICQKVHIAIIKAGTGAIVDYMVGAFPFEYKDVMDIPNFKKFLSKVLDKCSHIIKQNK